MPKPKEILNKRYCYFAPNIDRVVHEYAAKNHLSYSDAVEALVAKAARVKIEHEFRPASDYINTV